MGSPGSRGSSARKSRAHLLLSLILLVWNAAAAARFPVESVPPSLPEPGLFPQTSVVPSGIPPGGAPPVSARRGPLNVRQKYLLGKPLDINRAVAGEISELPGISDAVAASVVEERRRRGGFRNPRELLAVPGIKEKRLEKILPFLSEMGNN